MKRTTNKHTNKLPLNYDEAAEIMKLLSNPQRMSIVCNLATEELSVNDLADRIGLSQSALSQHLTKLKDKKLLKCRREHNKQIYSVESSDAGRIIDLLRDIYCNKKNNSA